MGLFGIGTFTQVNSISSAITGFFDPNKAVTVSILGMDYSIATIVGSLLPVSYTHLDVYKRQR